MKPALIRSTSLYTPFILLLLFTLILSCSKDAISEVENGIPQSEETDMDDTTGDMGEPPAAGVTFESGFILDGARTTLGMVLSQEEYSKFIGGEGDLALVTQKIYQYIEDDYDLIIILSVETSHPDGLFFGRSSFIKNDVMGIGAPIFDNTATYGSSGRLKSIIYMPRSEYIRQGPFLHEIAHSWGNHGFLDTTVGGHWGYASTGGQLGGFDELVSLGNDTYRGRLNGGDGFGTFANGGNTVPYGNVELYIMGLIGADDIEPVQLAVNPVAGATFGEFTADAIETITAADIVAQHGARVPNVENSQKNFKALTVLISPETIEQDKIDATHSDLENFSRQAEPDASWGNALNFWEATDARATIDFTVLEANIK
ncbi:hypothetical protein [Spongiimicrobium sp. 3-5]|uniref:hypothetical protein n=1 Tax=Spongiimicrobium sp. 3-5 TaxID=3332596 RepID=UPI00397FB4BE